MKRRMNYIEIAVACYLIFPVFFRLGPISVYHVVLLGAVALLGMKSDHLELRKSDLKMISNSWIIHVILLFAAMLYHREIVSIAIYCVTPGLLVVLLFMVIREERQVLSLIDTILVVSVINAFVSIFEWITSINLGYLLCTDGTVSYGVLYRNGVLRVAGLFVNAINNGLFCVFASGLALLRIYFKNEASRAAKRKYWIVMGLNVLVILRTYSRMAILAEIFVVFFVLLSAGAFHLTKNKVLGIILAFFVVLGIILIPNPIQERLVGVTLSMLKIVDDFLGTSFVSDIASSAAVDGIGNRMELYSWVWSSLGNNTIFGMGKAAKFRYTVNQWFDKVSIENAYLVQLFRYGMVGLIAQIILYLDILVHSAKKAWFAEKSEYTLVHRVFFLMFFSYFLSFFTVANSEEKKLFYVLVAIARIFERIEMWQGETRRCVR